METIFTQIGQFHVCNIPKSTTLPIVIFDFFIIISALIILSILYKRGKNNILKYLYIAVGIFIFEFFTSPMWNNWHLGSCAYVYQDVSWILTIGWATLIIVAIIIIDEWFKKWREWKKFLLYLGSLTIVVFFFEVLLVHLGVRSYAPEVLTTISGIYLWKAPIEAFYYIPVFLALVIGFYKYWNFVLENKVIAPSKKINYWKKLGLSFLMVFLFELVVEPMVVNAKLPQWSYIYRDISIIMAGLWVLIIWISVTAVDKFFIHWSLKGKFIMYLAISCIMTYPLEAFFIKQGYRVYGESAVANFSGFITPITNIPVEIAFAFPLYMALIIASIKYWEIVFKNKL